MSEAARSAGRWLGLAAAPTFVVMAIMTAFSPQTQLCGPAASSPLSGMAAMYLLMSVFHAAPWLRLKAEHDRRPPSIQERSSH
ncbi:MAG: hypothetical protein KKE02_02540 [Alphaproteobacteria bacterium]|nr:hypothetical protein [Alphaproteobacteria bacterium]MBU1513444.1 hypothetical protein [Alphaproteobacteria bacterium]MBU2096436.1 hypothetical protein [Alphaproteobacteria bacterium]MBU2149872.1 hypothetical protein [Alphaproteobacteria bacterium]MBU2308222.1 hypothetical protein [Alphaproteobacteria bacterium]